MRDHTSALRIPGVFRGFSVFFSGFFGFFRFSYNYQPLALHPPLETTSAIFCKSCLHESRPLFRKSCSLPRTQPPPYATLVAGARGLRLDSSKKPYAVARLVARAASAARLDGSGSQFRVSANI